LLREEEYKRNVSLYGEDRVFLLSVWIKLRSDPDGINLPHHGGDFFSEFLVTDPPRRRPAGVSGVHRKGGHKNPLLNG
jgi:hypothetical protein